MIPSAPAALRYSFLMPYRLTLAQMMQQIRTRKLSPVELVDAHLKQIEAVNPAINAFVMQFPSEARAMARYLENEPPMGPLHGIPVTVKDSFDMRELPTLCGSRFRLEHRAAKDSTAVARLREAGAVILGKTNCPEFLANYETDNFITGRTSNPWNVEYTAGGSSGGESAAIAACCSAGGIGSDGGGSIRVPAHFCGIAGLKPTPGRVSAAGHFPEISHPGGLLGVAGPMARTVEDVRVLFNVLAGYDAADPFSAPVTPRRSSRDGLRIGLIESVSGRGVQADVHKALMRAAGLLERCGFHVEPFRPKVLEGAVDLWWFFFGQLPAPFTREVLAGRESDAHWTVKELLSMVDAGHVISGSTVVEKLGARDRMRAALLEQMRTYPVLLTPPCGIAAFPHRVRGWETPSGAIDLIEAMGQASPFNLLGLPGLVLPMSVTDSGIPVGVQLAGGPYDEELLMDVGEKLEEARGAFSLAPMASLPSTPTTVL